MDKAGFTAYMESKGFSPRTQKDSIKKLNQFFDWLGTCDKEDTCTAYKVRGIQVTKPDILHYLEHLKNSRAQQNATRKTHLITLNHYFTHLYQSEQISVNPCLFLKIRGTKRRALCKIYSPEELVALFDNYDALFVRNYNDSHIPPTMRKQAALIRDRNAAVLSIFVHQGIFTSETGNIETEDLDLIKAVIRIRGSEKRLKERILPLNATQMGVLMHYLQNTRPKILQYHATESKKLFLPLPGIGKNETDDDEMCKPCYSLTPALKSIDKQFVNFKQVRASLITHWIKTHGLRKAQYMAGHRSIIATEEYAINDLDDLTNDVNKLHPFNM